MDNINIYHHWLKEGDNVTHIHCPKNKVVFAAGLPDTIVLHYTAGSNGKSSAEYLAKGEHKASAHVVIDRSGHIYQLVPFNMESWHAGKSEYDGRSGFNQYAIGIELDNAGILTPENDHFVSWFGKSYPPEDVLKATHKNETTERYWHTFTNIQINMCQWLCAALKVEYPGIKHILGHDDIAPGRKQDPGPAFPMERVRNLLEES